MKKSYSLIFLPVLFLCGCSSAPKRTMQINTIYKNVTVTIESANTAMINANYAQAENLLNSAYKNAISIDNYDLLATVSLSFVNLYLSFNEPSLEKAKDYLEEALYYSDFSANPEKNKALCTLSYVRYNLAASKNDYDSYLKELDQSQNLLKADKYNFALFESVKADVLKEKKDFAEAERLYLNAAELFTKNRYLGEIGITWYKTAQVRSLQNKKASALEAIENAIKYDRDAENSIALGTDYYAKALILLKANPSQEEIQKARESLKHSSKIFDSIGLTSLAQKSLSLIED